MGLNNYNILCGHFNSKDFGWRYDIRNEVLGVVHHLLRASFIDASDWYPSAEYKMKNLLKYRGVICLFVCLLFLFRMILSAEMNFHCSMFPSSYVNLSSLSRNKSVLEIGHITGRIWSFAYSVFLLKFALYLFSISA